MNFDWKATLGTVAPVIAGMVGSPIAGLAVKAGLAAFGISAEQVPADHKQAEDLLAEKIQNATPADMLALKQANNDFEKTMKELDIKHDQLFVDDTKDARAKNADNSAVFRLGLAVLATFAATMSAALYGCYELLTGGIVVKDVGIVAAVFGLIGTIIGYLANNAQQVVNFCFGSSRGSKAKTDAMAASFARIGGRE